MGTTALSVLLKKVLEELGDYRTETATSSAAGSIAAATVLTDKPDNFYNDWWVMPMAGTYINVPKRVSTFTSSTGAFVPLSNWAGAPGNVAFIVSRFNPADITRALNEAAQEGYPYLAREIVDETLITGDWLRNGGFEDWAVSTIPDNWANLTAITIAKVTTPILSSARVYGQAQVSLACIADGDGIGQSAVEHKRLLDLVSHSVTFRAFVLANGTAAKVRIGQTSGYTYSSALASSNTWELLSVTATIASTSKSTKFDVMGTTTITVYADNARVVGPPKYDYYLPSSFRHVTQVSFQTSGLSQYPCDDLGQTFPFAPLSTPEIHFDGTDRVIYLPLDLPHEHKIRLVGKGTLSTLSALTDTVELDGFRLRAFVKLACHKLMGQYSNLVTGQMRGDYEKKRDDFYRDWEMLRSRHCATEPVYLPRAW